MEPTFAPGFELELNLLLESINLKYDYDFRHYAPKSLRRTLVQALSRLGCPTLSALQEKVLKDPESFYDLVQALTIPVSEMFRDPSYFLSLRERVVPFLRTYPSLKIWVAGCSTGEEVYSLAILLQEEGLLERTTLYATDINPRTLASAAKGGFPLAEIERAAHRYLASGGKRSLSDYYTTAKEAATFHPSLSRNVTFTNHSLVTDAVFSETHLISCRNVLIYFNRKLQDRAHGLFYDSLCRKCFLGLGSQETVRFSRYADCFDSFVKHDRILQTK